MAQERKLYATQLSCFKMNSLVSFLDIVEIYVTNYLLSYVSKPLAIKILYGYD